MLVQPCDSSDHANFLGLEGAVTGVGRGMPFVNCRVVGPNHQLAPPFAFDVEVFVQ